MIFFWTGFWIAMKNASKIPFWLAAAMIPAVITGAGLLFGETGTGLSIQIGIYGEPGFQIYGGGDWTLRHYDSREAMRQDVAARRLELGYAFSEDEIILYTAPGTMSDRVTNLLIGAAYLESVAGEVGGQALSPFISNPDIEDIQARIDRFLTDGPLMERIVIVHGEEGAEAENIPFRRLFHGLLALFGQLLAMLCTMGYADKNEKMVSKRVKTAGTSRWVLYTLSGIGAAAVMTGIVMSAAVLTAAFMFPGVWVMQDALTGIIYLLAVSTLGMLWAKMLPEGLYMPVVLVFFIFTALMGGVIFDLREVLEAVGFLRFLFPSHYYMVSLL